MSKFPAKLSELELLSGVTGDDYTLFVDKSDTFQSENGSTKKVTASTLREYILSNFNFGSINNHSDVSIQNRVDGQLLRYNSQNAKWENWTHNFLIEEEDPVFLASDAAKINFSDITNWNTTSVTVQGGAEVSGTFTTTDGQTITVTDGIITSIA